MTADEDNGILAEIRGDVIGAAAARLPRAGRDQAAELVADVDAGPPLGMVRIRYQAKRHRHGKSETWFWVAVHAEKVLISTGTIPPEAA